LSTFGGIEPNLVLIGWTGPGGDSVTTNSRVAISPTTSIDNDYNNTLQFAYLMERDEGMSKCDMMILIRFCYIG